MSKKGADLTDKMWEDQYSEVSEDLKGLWSVEMDILSEFERVCKKHNLTWYADGGTLLGAVRHQGYIPWDDDIDIIMPYEDYMAFSKLRDEFTGNYFLQTWETEDGFEPYLLKVRRSDTTGYNNREKRYPVHFNKGVFIDIFALCNVPENVLVRKAQLIIMKCIRALLHGYEADRDGVQTANNKLVDCLLKKLYQLAKIFADHRKLSRWYCQIAGWKKKKGEKCGALIFDPGKKNLIWESKWYDKTVMLPFMGRDLPCPCAWDKRLSEQYGDYMTPVKGTSYHGELIYDINHPF